MITQEQIFQFFREMSTKLNNEGYPILDNIIHDFPGYPTDEEVFVQKLEEKWKKEEEESDSRD